MHAMPSSVAGLDRVMHQGLGQECRISKAIGLHLSAMTMACCLCTQILQIAGPLQMSGSICTPAQVPDVHDSPGAR